MSKAKNPKSKLNKKHFAIVNSRFNDFITKRLFKGCLQELLHHGIKNEQITTVWVPGAFEIPLVAKKLASKKNIDAIICLGAVIRGETFHFELIASEAARGIGQVALDTQKPVIFGVLSTDNINQAYKRFIPQEFLEHLGKESIIDVHLGDCIDLQMSVLFSDIRSFASISESMTPKQTFKFINSYLSQMGPMIRDHHGFIDKYIGDAIMALFSERSDDAVDVAIAMLKKLADYNEGRKRGGYPPIQIGIGINTGDLMLGIVGEHGRMEGTVISDAVNLASRIEGLTKMYGASLLISDATFHSLRSHNRYSMRIMDRVKVKGKSEPVTIFEVLDGELEGTRELKLSTLRGFEEGISLYYLKEFPEAEQRFQEVLVEHPGDKAAQLYLERCQQWLTTSLPGGWDGVTRLDTK